MVAHFCLATWFAMITPYRTAGVLLNQRDPATGGYAQSKDVGAPDERQHANYIGYLLKEGKLPVFNPKSPTLYEEYQSHQPPLYYFVASGVAKLTGQTDIESQSFGRTIRILNCLIGALGLWGIFCASYWGTRRQEIALVATAFVAFLPTNIALSSAISNDPLLICLTSWSVAFLFGPNLEPREPRAYYQPYLRAVFISGAVGILATAAFLTKSSGLISFLLGLGACIWALRTKNYPEISSNQRNEIRFRIIASLLMFVLITTMVWVRNINLYGDPLAQSAFKEAFVGSAQKTAILQAIEAGPSAGSPEVQYWINWIGYWTARSFIGVFGYMDIWLNTSGKANSNSDPNLLYKAIILFNFLGLGGGLLWLRNNWQENKRLGAITLGLVGLTVALFVMFNNTYFQAQARYLFPALSGFATLMAIGWVQIFRKWQIALALVVAIFGGLTVYAGTQLPSEFAKRTISSSP